MINFFKILSVLILVFSFSGKAKACSILYYIDKTTGKIYAVNNEDYWYDVKPFIMVLPKNEGKFARLWYGWDDFAQGGINEYGLFFDGAVTPQQPLPDGFADQKKGNMGDEILAECKTVDDAINFLENKKVALTNAHIFFGDKTGNAVVIEWVQGIKKLVFIKDNYLVATNFLLSDITAGNYPCNRYNAIMNDIQLLRKNNEPADLKRVGNIVAKAVQLPVKDQNGKTGGTLYSTFIDITGMEFKLVYKLDNSKLIQLDLNKEFNNSKKQKIKLE